jgi:hypothetical protein
VTIGTNFMLAVALFLSNSPGANGGWRCRHRQDCRPQQACYNACELLGDGQPVSMYCDGTQWQPCPNGVGPHGETCYQGPKGLLGTSIGCPSYIPPGSPGQTGSPEPPKAGQSPQSQLPEHLRRIGANPPNVSDGHVTEVIAAPGSFYFILTQHGVHKLFSVDPKANDLAVRLVLIAYEKKYHTFVYEDPQGPPGVANMVALDHHP